MPWVLSEDFGGSERFDRTCSGLTQTCMGWPRITRNCHYLSCSNVISGIYPIEATVLVAKRATGNV